MMTRRGLMMAAGVASGLANAADARAAGAKGDGRTLDTAALQRGIDGLHESGGGILVLPAGRYRTGTLVLRSGTGLHLDQGAVVLGSADAGDYEVPETLPYESYADRETSLFRHALIRAEDAEGVSITGPGEIDANRTRRGGPKPVSLKNCKRVTLRDFTIRRAPNYAISFIGCEDVVIDGCRIREGYSDGIDPDSSRGVRISNCYVESHDDAICLKASLALGRRVACEQVTVTNCVLVTSSNGFKLGTESSGDFRDITFSNSVILRKDMMAQRDRGGILISSVDGSRISQVVVSNVTIRDVHAPLLVRLGNRGRGMEVPVPGLIEDVQIQNVTATGSRYPAMIAGLPGHPVRRVTLSDVSLTVQGGETTARKPEEVPENPAGYPETDMFGVPPASAMFVRHARDLTMRGIRYRVMEKDARPEEVLVDLEGR
jgi:polygalacturonase